MRYDIKSDFQVEKQINVLNHLMTNQNKVIDTSFN